MRGRRVNLNSFVIYQIARSPGSPDRFGFVVSKAVGGAVTRNLVKRRLRAIAREILNENIQLRDNNGSTISAPNYDTVIRALPPIAELNWNRLREEVLGAYREVRKKHA